MKNVVVVGGGIIGLSSALYLVRSGHRVTVVDKQDFQDNCSYGNLGYVCPSHFIPLAAPGIVWQGIKWMFDNKSPFYVQPSFNRSLIDWGINFMRSANKKHVAASAAPLLDIALLSQQAYGDWEKIPGLEFSFERKGMLEIFQTEAAQHHAAETVATAKRLGLDTELLDHASLAALEPQTRINALGAIYFKCDSHLYPNKLMASLKKYLSDQGVNMITDEVVDFRSNGTDISAVVGSKDTYAADVIVLASGSWSRALAARLKTNISLMPGRGYSFTMEDSPYRLNHPAILTEARVAICPMDGNKMRYGGTMEIVAADTPPRYHRVEGIVSAIGNFFPEFKIGMPAQDKIWSGFRPTSADGIPYIGRTNQYRNVIIATGHAMLGLSLGAGTGKLVGQLVDQRATDIDITPFDVNRFS